MPRRRRRARSPRGAAGGRRARRARRAPRLSRWVAFASAIRRGHSSGRARPRDLSLGAAWRKRDDRTIPTRAVRRSARGRHRALGTEGARFAGTKAAQPRALAGEGDASAWSARHLESAERLVETLGTMKGAAMKMGQLASFIDTDFLPDEYRELYQEKLGKLRTSAPAMPWEKVRKVLDEEYDEPFEELFERLRAARRSRPRRSARCTAPRCPTAAAWRSRSSTRASAARSRADLSNAGMILRLAKALAPGPRRQGGRRGAEGARARGARLRVRGAEPARVRARLPRPPVHLRAGRGHAAVAQTRVLVTEYVEGVGFEEVKQLAAGGARPLRRDRVPLLLRLDLPAPALQRRRPPRQLPADATDGRVAFLDFGMTKRLDQRADRARDRGDRGAASTDDPERLREKLHDLGFLQQPEAVDAEQLMEHVDAVGGWYLEDGEVTDRLGT